MCKLDPSHDHNLPRHLPAAAAARSAAAESAPATPEPARKTRRKLWELPHKLHCPVIGTCLDAAELRRIARKARAQADGNLSDYDVHVSFVAAADDKNPLSLAAHKALEKKFASQVRRFARARSSEQLTGLWDQALALGDIPGALWATLTHSKCDTALRMRCFEEVHMLSHQIGAGQHADLRRLNEAERERDELKRAFDDLQRRTRRQLEDREQRIVGLEHRLRDVDDERRRLSALQAALCDELAELRRSHAQRRITALQAELTEQRQQRAQAEQAGERWQAACEAAERRVGALEADCRDLTAECRAMERLLDQSLGGCDACAEQDCGVPPDLAGRRILCVGGRNRLIEQYRELVARCNGRFEHHDGGVEDNRQRLGALLSAADAVVCPVDCVSHDAYYRLKRFCKRHRKPHVFLPSSGISAFVRALDSMAACESERCRQPGG
jgi:hypothetical protein